VTNMALHK